ncbi:MAG: SpvB/TcaC N-terminal domain-containing protein [Solirubrobacterales bacterium]
MEGHRPLEHGDDLRPQRRCPDRRPRRRRARIFRWLPELSYDNRGNWIAYVYRAEDGAGMPATAAEAPTGAPAAHRTSTSTSSASATATTRPGSPTPTSPTTRRRWRTRPATSRWWLTTAKHDLAAPAPMRRRARTGRGGRTRSSYRSAEIRTARLCRRVLMFHHFPDEALGEDARWSARST